MTGMLSSARRGGATQISGYSNCLARLVTAILNLFVTARTGCHSPAGLRSSTTIIIPTTGAEEINMVHTVTVEDRENAPVYRTLVRLDISELDASGVEEFSPETEHDDQRNTNNQSGLVLPNETLSAVDVLEWEDESLHIMWDTVDEELKVKNLADGTDIAANTAVGEVLLEVRGGGN